MFVVEVDVAKLVLPGCKRLSVSLHQCLCRVEEVHVLDRFPLGENQSYQDGNYGLTLASSHLPALSLLSAECVKPAHNSASVLVVGGLQLGFTKVALQAMCHFCGN